MLIWVLRIGMQALDIARLNFQVARAVARDDILQRSFASFEINDLPVSKDRRSHGLVAHQNAPWRPT
jgi:hypothetical protein